MTGALDWPSGLCAACVPFPGRKVSSTRFSQEDVRGLRYVYLIRHEALITSTVARKLGFASASRWLELAEQSERAPRPAVRPYKNLPQPFVSSSVSFLGLSR